MKKFEANHNSEISKNKNVNNSTIYVKNADGDPETTANVILPNHLKHAPKVSVIMPVHNVEPYLRQCLDSVINQTLREIEIICVDDGSTDGSLKILKEYAAKDRRITVLKQKNLHAGVARNAGISIAKGRYLCFLDSDDFFEPNMLELMYRKAQEDVSDVVVCGYSGYNDETQEHDSISSINSTLLQTSPINPKEASPAFFTQCFPNPWTKLIKKDLFTENQIRFEKFIRCNDFGCIYTILALADKISLINEPFIHYRHGTKSQVSHLRRENSEIFLQAAAKLEGNFTRLGIYDRFFDKLSYAISTHLRFETDNNPRALQKTAQKYLSKRLNDELFSAKISVIIPVYNVEPYLRECLDSVIKQTLIQTEIICVNDGSTDNSLKILKEYAAKDKRIKIIDQQNQGLSCSRNNALKIAQGEYIMFLDSDDWIRYDACEILYNKSKQYNLDMLNFAGINFRDNPLEYFQLRGQTMYYIKNNQEIYDRESLKSIIKDIPISACRYFYRRQFLEENQIRFPEGINFEDNYFVRKSLLFVQNFGTESATLYYRRVHNQSITQNEDKFFDDYIEIVRRVDNLYTENNFDFEAAKGVIRNYCNILYNKYKHFSSFLQYRYRPHIFALLVDMQRKYQFTENEYLQKEILNEWYKWYNKDPFTLDNPKTYNEKMQWMKLHDSTPIKTRLADKYLVREWIKEKIGEKYLIPLIGVYDRFEDIDFAQLPDKFVIKCNHGCAYNIIVKDKSTLDLADVKEKLDRWMKDNFAFHSWEMHYMNIPPKIIIEQYIENNGGDLYDYKFWCFNGKVKYIQFLSERYLDGLKMAFYDTKWKKQTFVYDHPLDKKIIKKPDNLNKMIRLAETLSKDFNHVRVDFYRLNDGTILFGEMTFSSASGSCRWNDEKYNRLLGKLIKLPENAYDVLTNTYTKLPNNYHKEIFSALHPEIPVPFKPQKHVLSYKLFNFIPLFSYIQCGGRKVWKIFGLPVWKIRRFENNITTKYYLCGLPFIKVSKK